MSKHDILKILTNPINHNKQFCWMIKFLYQEEKLCSITIPLILYKLKTDATWPSSITQYLITSTWSLVTFSIFWIRGMAAASPHRWSSSAEIPNRARVNEKPLFLQPSIWPKRKTKKKSSNCIICRTMFRTIVLKTVLW